MDCCRSSGQSLESVHTEHFPVIVHIVIVPESIPNHTTELVDTKAAAGTRPKASDTKPMVASTQPRVADRSPEAVGRRREVPKRSLEVVGR